MSLDKAIAHGKEHRKPYIYSKATDGSCRNHGACKWCKENRLHKFRDKHPPEKELDNTCDLTCLVESMIIDEPV